MKYPFVGFVALLVAGAVQVGAQVQLVRVPLALDGDVEKALVERFKVRAYQTMIVLDPAGRETHRVVGYLPSTEALALLNR